MFLLQDHAGLISRKYLFIMRNFENRIFIYFTIWNDTHLSSVPSWRDGVKRTSASPICKITRKAQNYMLKVVIIFLHLSITFFT